MTKYSHLTLAAIIALLILSPASWTRAQQTTKNVNNSDRIEAVWKREELYWRYVLAGDVDNYRTLWDEGFRDGHARKSRQLQRMRSETGFVTSALKKSNLAIR